MDQLNEVLITAIVFFSILGVVKVVSDNRLRRKLIEKGVVDENVKQLYSNPEKQTLSSLKWGFVLVGLGLALLIGQMMPVDMQDEVIVGGMFILAGAGLLLFYYISNRLNKNPD